MIEYKCDSCGKTFERKLSKIKRAEKHYCSNACRFKGQEMSKRKSWIKDCVVYLETTKGMTALIDEVDKDLADLNWQSNGRYVIRKDKERKYVFMHRMILERILGRCLEKDEVADHINGNGFDNRRENLRLSTHAENCANIIKPSRINTDKKHASKYKGVNFDEERGLWRARITCRGTTSHLGYFGNEEDAAEAYDMAAIIFYDNYAKLNFPHEWYAWEIHKKSGCAYKVKA